MVFNGTSWPSYLDSPLKAPVLGHFGNKDTHVPEADLIKAQAYLPELEVHIYEAGHAFANDKRELIVEAAATQAHERNKVFLQRLLG